MRWRYCVARGASSPGSALQVCVTVQQQHKMSCPAHLTQHCAACTGHRCARAGSPPSHLVLHTVVAAHGVMGGDAAHVVAAGCVLAQGRNKAKNRLNGCCPFCRDVATQRGQCEWQASPGHVPRVSCTHCYSVPYYGIPLPLSRTHMGRRSGPRRRRLCHYRWPCRGWCRSHRRRRTPSAAPWCSGTRSRLRHRRRPAPAPRAPPCRTRPCMPRWRQSTMLCSCWSRSPAGVG